MAEFKLTRRALPADRQDARLVWLVSIGAVLLSFGILFFIAYGPHPIVHRAGPWLVWVLILLVLCALGADFMALRRRIERVSYDLTFELDQDELIRKRPGHPDVRIPLSQIASLYKQSGRLVIVGGDPLRRIVIPKEIENFNLLRAQLLKHAHLSAPPRRFSLGSIRSLLSLICWLLLAFAGHMATIRAAAVGVLILLAWESLRPGRQSLFSPKRAAYWVIIASGWLAAGFLIYIRIFGGSF